MIDLRRLRLLVDTARHLTPAQQRARVVAMAKSALRKATKPRFELPRDVRVAAHQALHDAESAERLANARAIAAGTFRFIGVEAKYDGEPRWHDPTVSRLFRYHLHYFDYALDLAAANDVETFRRLVRSWLRENATMTGDGWHPYTVSLRIVNWCRALDAFTLADEFRDDLARAIYGQARFLFANLEHDVRGNHLLENLRALIRSGVMFEGGEAARWLRDGLRMLEREVAEQVLADGGHFERTPSYHVVVLRDLVEIAELLRANREVPRWLDDAIARMFDFLDKILGPNDRLPLFKDSTLTDVPTLTSRAPRTSEFLAASGYAIMRDDRVFLIADFGKPCPDYLPAHAHADMFSYELTLDGKPLVVDSGVFEYEAGQWRDWFRSTRAHNTVEVAGENQSEVWGSFRVARRARPHNVVWLNTADASVIQGEHDGYTRLRPSAIHRRTIAHLRGVAIVVIDEVTGSGGTRAESRIHLHPDAQLSTTRLLIAGARLSEGEGWYSERFGERVANRVLTLTAEGEMPLRFVYALALRDGVTLDTRDDGDAFIVTAGSVTLRLPRSGSPIIE
ncbi:MAG: hypothetical protein QOI24_3414 [Acidobacteriota bacterium]|nr:hypothetical protein [Acidobacteriota bacterium]